MKKRIWQDIPGYEGKYQASTEGEIKSISGRCSGTIHKGALCKKGYHKVCLYKDGKARTHRTHKLILNTFYPNPDPEKFSMINHKNGIKLDNRLCNLEWSNNSLNQKHAFKMGYQNNVGSNHPRAKLDEEKVQTIKFMLMHNIPYRDIGELFGISISTISAIKAGRLWRHVCLD